MSALRLDGQVVIVTGAGTGLGRAYAMHLAERGAKVVVNDLSVSMLGDAPTGEDRARRVVDEIVAAGGEAVANDDSVASADAGERIVQTAIDAFGRLDALVNNAGHKVSGRFAELTDDEVDRALSVHLRGVFSVTRPAWRIMEAQGHGRIVLTGSLGFLGQSGTSPYSAAKAGMIGLARVLASEGAAHGIKVNVVVPTAQTTNLAGGDEAWTRWFAAFRPEAVAPVIVLLTHAECPWSGEVINAGMGRVSRLFLGETRGFYDDALTAESLAAHAADVMGEEGYAVPVSTMDAVARWIEVHPYGDGGGPRLTFVED